MSYSTEALMGVRREKDKFFKQSAYSPLTPKQQQLFAGLNYFPPDPALSFDLTPIIFDEEAQTLQRIMTSTNEIRHYRRWGRLEFTVEGQTLGLTLFQDEAEQYFFLLFADATNDSETYASGRYIDVEALPGGRLRLDFNQAYNPYCAYNEPPSLLHGSDRQPQTWSCPIPPAENRLKVPIRAGEKKPEGDWVIQDHESHPDQVEG